MQRPTKFIKQKRRPVRKGADDSEATVAVDKKSRHISYIGDINWTGVALFIQAFRELSRARLPVSVELCTEGGDVDPGMAMYDIIKQSRSWVRMRVIGTCQSMGTVVLQAADERIMAPNATLMHHLGSTGGGGNLSPDEHAESAKFDAKRYKDIDYLVWDRVRLAKFYAAWPAFQKITTKSVWMTAAQAVERGFADAVS